MKSFKQIVIIILIIAFLVFGALMLTKKASACGWFTDCAPATQNEVQKTNAIQNKLVADVPIPQLETSQERINVAKRAEIFSKSDKLSYIYLISYGKVMAFYTVKGKVSSLRSYMAPMDKLVDYKGNPCTYSTITGECFVVEAPDIDGTYGENVSGIFFFTTEGAYVEYKGEYMMSDQPLKLSTPPALVRNIE